MLENAIRLDPQNPENLKQVGHSLYLLGQHKVALEVFNEALSVHPTDWEIYREKGLCHLYLSQLTQCVFVSLFWTFPRVRLTCSFMFVVPSE